jgi:alginate O-acetyltransferase complex protein AlgI
MFVIWGGLNGLGIIVYKFWRKISPYENSTHWIVNTWKILLTFTFITFTRIWFRGESMQGTFDLMRQISSHFGWPMVPQMILNYWKVFILMAVGFIIHWLPESLKVWYRNWFINRPVYQQIAICVLVVFVLYQSVSAGLQPFIYFQF